MLYLAMLNNLNVYKIFTLERVQLSVLIFVLLIMLFANISIAAQPRYLVSQENIFAEDLKAKNYFSVISTTIIQALSFGTFCTGNSGGTVTIPAVGPRSSTGDIILIPSSPGSPAILQITSDTTNYVTITTGNIVNLSNGSGGSITLHINDFYPASPFNVYIGQNNVNVGGTLTVGPSATTPGGNYSGSFEVIFNEQ